MGNYIYRDQPCKSDCPDRQPGCYCQKKRDWDEQKNAKKQMIKEEKNKVGLVMAIRNPPRVRKARIK